MNKQLKDACNKNGNAIAMKLNKSGEALIYVSHDAPNDQVAKSLMVAITEILKVKDGDL